MLLKLPGAVLVVLIAGLRALATHPGRCGGAPKWNSPRPRGYDRHGGGLLHIIRAIIGVAGQRSLIDPGGTMRTAIVSSAPKFQMSDLNLHLVEEAAPAPVTRRIGVEA